MTRSSSKILIHIVRMRAVSLFPPIECLKIAKIRSHIRDKANYLGTSKVSYAQKWSLKIRMPLQRSRI